jgi:acyl carrier protein
MNSATFEKEAKIFARVLHRPMEQPASKAKDPMIQPMKALEPIRFGLIGFSQELAALKRVILNSRSFFSVNGINCPSKGPDSLANRINCPSKEPDSFVKKIDLPLRARAFSPKNLNLFPAFLQLSPTSPFSSFQGRAGMKTYVTPGAPLSKQQVQQRVIDVFRAFEKVNKANLSLTANASSDLGLDSLDMVEVTIAVEEDFNLEIPDAVAETFRTPNDIVEFMYSQCGDADVPEEERSVH